MIRSYTNQLYLSLILLSNVCYCYEGVYEFRYVVEQGHYGHGAAIAISEQQIITCAHLLGGKYQELKVGDKWYKCSLKHSDPEFDIALLQVDGIKLKSIQLNADKDMDKLTIVMYPKCKLVNTEATFIAKNGILYHYKAEGCQEGSSGGAAIKDGKCVGMVVANAGVIKTTGVERVIGTAVLLPTRRIIQFINEQKEQP